MARTPDRPGSYRVVPRNGKWMLTGVRPNGTRLKMRDLSRAEAERFGAQIFKAFGEVPVVTPLPPPVDNLNAEQHNGQVDDWGLPIRVKTDDVAKLNASLGIAPKPVIPAETAEKKEKRAKDAKSLMELGALVVSLGPVWAGRKICERTDRIPPKPSDSQLKDMRECTRETFTEWFGDHEVKPWQMMILLGFGIPISMFLQANRKPKLAEDAKANLKSVP